MLLAGVMALSLGRLRSGKGSGPRAVIPEIRKQKAAPRIRPTEDSSSQSAASGTEEDGGGEEVETDRLRGGFSDGDADGDRRTVCPGKLPV